MSSSSVFYFLGHLNESDLFYSSIIDSENVLLVPAPIFSILASIVLSIGALKIFKYTSPSLLVPSSRDFYNFSFITSRIYSKSFPFFNADLTILWYFLLRLLENQSYTYFLSNPDPKANAFASYLFG